MSVNGSYFQRAGQASKWYQRARALPLSPRRQEGKIGRGRGGAHIVGRGLQGTLYVENAWSSGCTRVGCEHDGAGAEGKVAVGGGSSEALGFQCYRNRGVIGRRQVGHSILRGPQSWETSPMFLWEPRGSTGSPCGSSPWDRSGFLAVPPTPGPQLSQDPLNRKGRRVEGMVLL